jgi:hypothetical protein
MRWILSVLVAVVLLEEGAAQDNGYGPLNTAMRGPRGVCIGKSQGVHFSERVEWSKNSETRFEQCRSGRQPFLEISPSGPPAKAAGA